MEDINEQISLAALGTQFQQAIIGHCLMNGQFLMQCRNNVEPGWFINLAHQNLMRIIYDIYDGKKGATANSRIPTQPEVASVLSTKYQKVSDFNIHVSEMTACLAIAERAFSFEFLSTSMTGWIRMIKLRLMLEDANRQYRKKDFNKCIDWINMKIRDVKSTSFMDDIYETFDDPIGFLQSIGKTRDVDCCTFGHPEMDEIMKTGSMIRGGNACSDLIHLRDFTRGSMMPGDMTVLMGPTNSGKTTTVITIVAANIRMGKYVGLITHEQDAGQLKLKILSTMMQMATNDLILNGPNDPKYVMMLQVYSRMLNEHLRFVHYAKPGGMFVEDVIPIVESMQEEVSLHRTTLDETVDCACGAPHRRVNRGLDLLVEDYPAKLKSRALKTNAIWDEKQYVYNEFLNLGQTYNFHVLAPVQTNRAGYRVGRGDHQEARALDVDDVAEGFGVMTIAANVITINRSDNYKALGIIKYYVAKSRSNETGHSMVLRTAFGDNLAFDVAKQALHLQPGQQMSDQEIMQAMGLSVAGPSGASQQARQDSLAQARAIQSSPEVPPGQPMTTPPAATETPVVSSTQGG
jgi:hypothetical protein